MERTPTTLEHDEPLVYALDRRGPNDPGFGSIHVVIALLALALVAGTFALL